MLINKEKDMTPFDMKRLPMQQKWYLMPLLWGGSWIMTRQFKLKIHKKNMDGFKSPYLVIATHQGFSDYYIAPLALFPHRANYVSDMEGFAAFGEWLYRAIGCIGKRRYVPDITVVKNIKHALGKGRSVVIYPESRHSNVGTTAYIPPNMGKLVKAMKVPLVILTAHGSYLANPFWDEEHTRKVPMEATLEGVYTAEEVEKLAAREIQRTIEEKLQYDEYLWQKEHHIEITDEKRAEGLHKALYQCRACGTEFSMRSSGSRLHCKKCGAIWELAPLGYLEEMSRVTLDAKTPMQAVAEENGTEQIHIPDWYEWQRKNVIKEIQAGKGEYTYKVRVEILPNAKGFIELGEGMLKLDAEGFYLHLDAKGDQAAPGHEERVLFFAHGSRESVQTEYNYRGKGPGIVLSDRDCCYYIYSQEEHFNPTKIQFVGEYLHQKH